MSRTPLADLVLDALEDTAYLSPLHIAAFAKEMGAPIRLWQRRLPYEGQELNVKGLNVTTFGPDGGEDPGINIYFSSNQYVVLKSERTTCARKHD
jgi:hypothetical protein